jgi:HEAT repeat protein
MKQNLRNRLTKLAAAMTVALTLTVTLNAQEPSRIDAKAVKNLKAALVSENDGVRTSAIYMAGLYRVDEAAEMLRNEIRNGKDGYTKKLAALSLYRIGDEEGMRLISKMAKTEQDKEVKRIYLAVVEQYNTDAKNVLASH